MNKTKVIELLKLIKNEKFYKELMYFTNNDKLKEEDIDYTKILNLTEDEIDIILNSPHTKLKAYNFYMYIIDKKYKKEEKEELIKYLNDKKAPYFLLDYIRNITVNPNIYFRINKELKMIEKMLKNTAFKNEIKYIIDNENIKKEILPRLLEAITYTENIDTKNLILNLSYKEKMMNHKEAIRIIEALSQSENIEISKIVYQMLINEEIINNIDNLCYIIEQILKTTPEKAKIAKETLEDEKIQKLCSPRNIIESIIEGTNDNTSKIASELSKNPKLQTKDEFYNYIKDIATAKDKEQAVNGKLLLEYLIENEKLEKYKTIQLLRGITRAKEKEISSNALKAATNEKLQEHKDYEQIVYNLGIYPKNIESSNYGLKTIETQELQKNKNLFKIVNYIISDLGIKENQEKAYSILQNKDIQTKPYLDFIIEIIMNSKEKEKVNLVHEYLNNENNKDIEKLSDIIYYISNSNSIEKSKIIYNLANNKEIINLEEEGMAIIEDVYNASTKEEIDYILNEKYNINNLENPIRLIKLFENNSSSIIEELEKLEKEDISKETIVKRKIRK